MTPEERAQKVDRLAKIRRLKEIRAIKAQRAPVAAVAEEPSAPEVSLDNVPQFDPVADVKEDVRDLSHIAGGVNKMVVDTLNLPFTASKWLGQKVFGDDPKAGFDLYDIPYVKGATAPAYARGEKPVLDAARAGAEWGSGGLLSKAPRAATTGLDALMGAGAAAGSYFGETGETVGGFGGMLASFLRGKPRVDDQATEKALDFLGDNVENTVAAREALNRNLDEGNVGTLLDLTEDLGFTGVEKMGPLKASNLSKIKATEVAREAQVVKQMQAPFGTATADQAVDVAQGLTKARQGRIDQASNKIISTGEAAADAGLAQTRAAGAEAQRNIDQVAGAVETAERGQARSIAEVAPAQESFEASSRAHDAIAKADAKFKLEIEGPAWDEFRAGGTVPAKEAQTAIDDALAKLTPEAAEDLVRANPSIFKQVKNWEGDVAAESIDYVRKSFADQINQSEHFGSVERSWKSLADAMDNSLTKGSRGAEYRAAIDATKARHAKFSQGAVAKNMRQQADAPEAFLEKFNFKGDAGKANARSLKATGETEAIDAVKDHFQSRAEFATIDEKFMKENAGFLSEFPHLQAKYAALAGAGKKTERAQGLAKAAGREQGSVIKAQEAAAKKLEAEKASLLPKTRERSKKLKKQTESSVVGRYADDRKGTIDKLLSDTSESGLSELKRLHKTMKGRGAEDSFKASVRDSLTSKIVTANNSTDMVRSSAIDKATAMGERLVQSKIITPKEYADMLKPLERSAANKLRRKGTAAVDVGKAETEMLNTKASALSALAMNAVPSGQNALMINGAVRRQIKSWLKKDIYDQGAVDRVADFIADPRLYSDALNAKTAKGIEEALNTAFISAQKKRGGLTMARELTNED